MIIAFDADDTLWHNLSLFNLTQTKVSDLLSEWVSEKDLEPLLTETERRNLRIFGYGVKGFTLSLIETAVQVSDGRVSGEVIGQILNAGKAMLEHPIELLPGVEETLELLGAEHDLMLITKGDLFDQESKIARSGLAPHFRGIEIVSEKDPEAYEALLKRYDIDPERFVMVGNSLKSDVLPVVKIGGNAIHLPYHDTWELERVDDHRGAEEEGFFEAGHMTEVPELIQRIAELGW